MKAAAFIIERENVVTGVFPAFDQLDKVRSQGVAVEGRYESNDGFSL
ncbi:hypothetical protein SAMN04488003_12716 [Loktanella fryxellensis]|uniref:Uncharacterized protein n=1 Tax=Loktanella fryxellensis TaxID=245187 RepID=A0A1H8INC0_9RHOB|nr:hypothetical protein [Loktanella fryxellensis]SEN70213.1 hypothetical protein SAMN04488003_12716 [Loktanella fryxellensis]